MRNYTKLLYISDTTERNDNKNLKNRFLMDKVINQQKVNICEKRKCNSKIWEIAMINNGTTKNSSLHVDKLDTTLTQY